MIPVTRSVDVCTDWYAQDEDFEASLNPGEIFLGVRIDSEATREGRDSGDLKHDEYFGTAEYTTLAAVNAAAEAASRVTLGHLLLAA